MIVVKVEFHNANTGAVTELGRAMIYNDGTGNPYVGNYQAIVHDKDEAPQKLPRIIGWPRLHRTVWQLMGAILAPILKHE